MNLAKAERAESIYNRSHAQLVAVLEGVRGALPRAADFDVSGGRDREGDLAGNDASRETDVSTKLCWVATFSIPKYTLTP